MVKLKTVYSDIEHEPVKYAGVKEPSQRLIESILKAKELLQKTCDYIAEVFKIAIEEEGYTKKEVITLLTQNGFSKTNVYRHIPLEYQSNEKGAGRKLQTETETETETEENNTIEIIKEQKIQDAEILSDVEENFSDESDYDDEPQDLKHFKELQKKNDKILNIIKEVYQPVGHNHNVENIPNNIYNQEHIDQLQKEVNDLKLHILKLESLTRKVTFESQLDLSEIISTNSKELALLPVTVTCMVNSNKGTVVVNMEKLREMAENLQ